MGFKTKTEATAFGRKWLETLSERAGLAEMEQFLSNLKLES